MTSVLAITATALLVVPPGAAPAVTMPRLSTLTTDCDAASGISGFATNVSGEPLVGAPVIVHAVPQNTGAEQRINLPLLGMTRTDSRGCYRVGVRMTFKLRAAADSNGVVNLKVMLQQRDRIEIAVVARRIILTSGGRTALRSVDASAPTTSRFVAARATVGQPVAGAVHQSFGLQATRARTASAAANGTVNGTGTIHLGGYTGVGTTQIAGDSVGVTPSESPNPLHTMRSLSGDTETLQHVFHLRPVLVGQWFSTTPGVTQTWRYARGSTTELGSAFTFG